MRALSMTLMGVLAFGLMAPPVEAQVVPTFNEHVGAILFENCSSCHRPNQVAPMSLLT